MKSDTTALLQLKEMIDNNHRITISEGFLKEYECTLYHTHNTPSHSHFGGKSIAEAINRTYKFYLTLKDKK